MMPETYIKTEPDDGTQIHNGSYSNNNDLMSRSLLTRGFNSNFDDYPYNSMIDDNDLLDGLHSPENPYSIPHSSLSHLGPPPPVPPNSTASNAHAMAAASIGFSSNTPSRPILSGSFSNQYGSTPPIPESTSPFDEFMLTNSRMANRPTQQQQSMRNQQDLRMAALSSPRPVDFQRVQGLNSATSTPVGSYEYPGSPPIHAAAALKKGGTPSSLPPNSPDDKQQMMLAERRRRRRESHNAVERRRRDNINEKIKELADLLPEAFLLGSTEPGSYSVVTKDEKPNKGTILSRSVDYIKQLQGIIDDQNRRELELQEQVNSLQAQCGIPQTEFKYTSAELALSKLGVSNDIKSPDSSSQQGMSGGTPNSLSNQEDPTIKYSLDY